MPITRREFLATGAATAAATLIPGRLLVALEKESAPAPATRTWEEVRALFPLSRDYLHFASFYLVSHPKPVHDAIEAFRRTVDANPYLVVERGLFESEADNLWLKVRQDVAPYLGARPEEIAITGNTTQGLALVYQGLPLAAGDDVLTTAHDHYVHHESIRFATERASASMRKVALFDRAEEASVDGIVGRLRAAIRPATRALGVTWVHSSSGVRLPIRAIADLVREVNAGRGDRDRLLLIVDGVHGLGAVDESVADLGCDFFCAGTHKWMFAPRGTGIVWARAESWARIRPTIPSFSSREAFESWMREEPLRAPTDAALVSPGGFHAFEHQWAMGAAFRFHQQLGRSRIGTRIRELNERCKEGLLASKRIRLHTPRDPSLSAGLVCFEVDGLEPGAVVAKLLERRVVASTSPYRVSYARLAPSLVTSPADVDAAVRAVTAIAGA
jgi:selenocysteine lyase/cysteine desulfurase